ncbi:hypothetical protein HK098_002645 [Nowakowskiella sp. JEL0407]|nr:hypothetical protein HK098_002645 [Nowakowskiella sp. JEL0407]
MQAFQIHHKPLDKLQKTFTSNHTTPPPENKYESFTESHQNWPSTKFQVSTPLPRDKSFGDDHVFTDNQTYDRRSEGKYAPAGLPFGAGVSPHDSSQTTTRPIPMASNMGGGQDIDYRGPSGKEPSFIRGMMQKVQGMTQKNIGGLFSSELGLGGEVQQNAGNLRYLQLKTLNLSK